MIQRRQFTSLLLATPLVVTGGSRAPKLHAAPAEGDFSYLKGITTKEKLIAPQGRPIQVAFAINPGVQVIDVAGPWEVFQDSYLDGAEEPAFAMFTVSETIKPIRGSGGLMIVPDYTIANAPVPDVIVVPHFDYPQPSTRETLPIHSWIKATHERAALTMSVLYRRLSTRQDRLARPHTNDNQSQSIGQFREIFSRDRLAARPEVR